MTDPYPVPEEFALRALAATAGEAIPYRYAIIGKRPIWVFGNWTREHADGMIRTADYMRWDIHAEQGYSLRMQYYSREYWVKVVHPPVPPLPSPTPPPEPEPEPDPEPPVVPEPEDPPADPDPDPDPEPEPEPEPEPGPPADPTPDPQDPPADPPTDPEQPGNN